MPIYELECSSCGRLEVNSPIVIVDKIDCPKCGGIAQRVMSPFSFTFAQPNTPKSKVNPKARPVRR